MKFDPRQAQTSVSTLSAAALCVLLLSACATPQPVMRAPATFREPCKGPNGPMRTQGDLDAFVVRQEAELQSCEAKRKGLVALIDAAAPKRRWWQFLKPDT